MKSLAVVDAGPLFAAADTDDRDHAASIAALSRPDLHLVLPALVIAEAAYFIGRHLGAQVEASFVRGIAELDIEAPTQGDFDRMAELIEHYDDFPLGTTDASAIALAERLDASVIVTLDRRHFSAVVPRHVPSFTLLP